MPYAATIDAMTVPPGPPPQPYPPPAVIEIGKADARRFVLASAIMMTLSLVAFVLGTLEVVGGRTGGGLVALAAGLVFLGIGLVPVFRRKRAFRPRRLVIEQAGIHWDDPMGEPWAVRWQELAAVALSRLSPADTGPEGLTDKINGTIVDRALGERGLVRLDLYPADAGFFPRHPEMAHLWTGDRLRLLLGNNIRLLPQLDAAIRFFQPSRYLGVQQATQQSFRLR